MHPVYTQVKRSSENNKRIYGSGEIVPNMYISSYSNTAATGLGKLAGHLHQQEKRETC